MVKNIISFRNAININKPLVHCITNNITINDCANVILALGGQAIMAEHKEEVVEITKNASALVLNLGNISDYRMASMEISAEIADKNMIPIILDLVGVSCSRLRLNFANSIIKKYKPEIIKGNLSECIALFDDDIRARGTDVSQKDSEKKLEDIINFAKKMALKYQTVIVISGEIDVIAGSDKVYTVQNGDKLMSRITGTGCMLSAVLGAFMNKQKVFLSALVAVSYFALCGENAARKSPQPASFKVALIDNLYDLSDEYIYKQIKIKEV